MTAGEIAAELFSAINNLPEAFVNGGGRGRWRMGECRKRREKQKKWMTRSLLRGLVGRSEEELGAMGLLPKGEDGRQRIELGATG